MATKNLEKVFGNIADAIRQKTGDTGKYLPSAMPEKILGIETKSALKIEKLTLTDVMSDANLNALVALSINGQFCLGGTIAWCNYKSISRRAVLCKIEGFTFDKDVMIDGLLLQYNTSPIIIKFLIKHETNELRLMNDISLSNYSLCFDYNTSIFLSDGEQLDIEPQGTHEIYFGAYRLSNFVYLNGWAATRDVSSSWTDLAKLNMYPTLPHIFRGNIFNVGPYGRDMSCNDGVISMWTRTSEDVMFSELVEITFPLLHVQSNAGAVVTATLGDKSYSSVADDNGFVLLTLDRKGVYSISATHDNVSSRAMTVNIDRAYKTYELVCKIDEPKIVGFSDGTDDEIAAMIDFAKNGYIDLQSDGGWKVGDTRVIHINAFTGGNVSYSEQDMEITITSFEDYNDCGAKMQFDFKYCLKEANRMNQNDTNSGGYKSTEMYATTLPALVKALPDWLAGRLVEFSVNASQGGGSTTIETVTGNELALRSESEMRDTRKNSAAGEGNQLYYYKTENNRIKTYGKDGEACNYWLRSPNINNSSQFCTVNPEGSYGWIGSSVLFGVAPFGCL